MSFASLRLALVAGLLLPLGLASAGFAQDAAAPPPAPGADAGQRHHHLDPAQMRARMAEHLRTALRLQPSQDGALNAYLDALKPPAGMWERQEDERGQMQHLTTPERLERMAARMDARRARMQTVIAATKQFYAQLSPSQQKAFDDLSMRMLARHGGHGMGGPGMGGPGMGEHGMRGPEGGPHRWGPGGDNGMGPDGSPRG